MSAADALSGAETTTIATVTERLEPIELADLVSEAALMTRVDRKYLVPAADAATILGHFTVGTRVLEIDGLRSLSYDSVYFDTVGHDSYLLTARKRRRRFKVRTRRYLDTDTAFLEVKTKDGRGKTVKERIPYEFSARDRLTEEGREFVAEVLGGNPEGAAARGPQEAAALAAVLKPGTESRYRRTTLLLSGGSRATVDTDLFWADPTGASVALNDHVIIESKSAGRASDLDRALWRAGHRPTGISKFGTGTAALNPDLPRNKWARTLLAPFVYLPETAATNDKFSDLRKGQDRA